MSEELRIALIAEGTVMEYHVLNAALTAILAPRSFELVQLQPEAIPPRYGAGWGGVLKWCEAAGRRHAGSLNTDPTLQTFDAIVLHLDADVAGFGYPDLRPPLSADAAAAKGWGALPCANPCPPGPAGGSALHAVLLSWLNPALPGPTGVVCLPAMNTGAWLAAATLPEGHELVPPQSPLECNLRIEDQLAQQPLRSGLRLNKARRADVLRAAPKVTGCWDQVRARCSRAEQFHAAVRAVFP